ncbi:MAG: peptidase [Deltaproteobacteria bacterium]|nr:peptidase [Deltaproteobacteria bacterium]
MAAGVLLEPVEVNDTLGVPAELARSPDTFALRVRGDSLVEEQIRDGDLILVQSVPAAGDGDTVLAVVRGEATVKRLLREDGRVLLRPANERLEPIVAEEDDVEIRGVVIAVIRKY